MGLSAMDNQTATAHRRLQAISPHATQQGLEQSTYDQHVIPGTARRALAAEDVLPVNVGLALVFANSTSSATPAQQVGQQPNICCTCRTVIHQHRLYQRGEIMSCTTQLPSSSITNPSLLRNRCALL